MIYENYYVHKNLINDKYLGKFHSVVFRIKILVFLDENVEISLFT